MLRAISASKLTRTMQFENHGCKNNPTHGGNRESGEECNAADSLEGLLSQRLAATATGETRETEERDGAWGWEREGAGSEDGGR